MRDVQKQIDRLVLAFVVAVTALAGEAATEALALELHDGEGAARARVLGAATPAGRVRRTRAALEATTARLGAFIATHPGLRVEQINAELGTTTRELALPLKVLLRAGAIRAEGAKRATAYYPAG